MEQMIEPSSPETLRWTGIKLMRFLVSTMMGCEHWQTFMEIFNNALKHPNDSLRVRVEAAKGLGACSAYLDDDEPDKGRELSADPILQVLKATIEANDETLTGNVIQVLNDLLDINPRVIGNAMAEVSKTMLQIANMKDVISYDTRAKAVKHLDMLCRKRMKMVQRMKMVLPIFQGCVEMLTEPYDEEDSDDLSLHSCASDALDTIFCQVPKQTFQSALSVVNKLTAETDSNK